MSWIRFSTEQLSPGASDSEKAAAWAEFHESRQTIGKSDVELAEGVPFVSEIISVELGSVSATLSRGSPAKLRRTTRLLRSDPTDQWVALLSATERPFFGHSLGRDFELSGGSMALLSYDIANTTQTNAIGTLYSLALPRADLASHVRHPESQIARAFSGDLPPLRLLRTHIGSIFAQQSPMDRATLALAGKHIRELICAVIDAQSGRPFDDAASGVKLARRTALDRIVSKRFRDPDFGIDQAAQALDISKRSLQVLLTESNETFSDLLTEARLCHARALLKNRSVTRVSVAEVAGDSGFGDISSFNRRYRAYFNERPTDTKPR